MPSLLAVDLGLKTGLALFEGQGKLLWYRSHNYGTTERLKRAVPKLIDGITQVRGIGRWTVEMLLIFGLGRMDVLPVDDFGVRKGFSRAYALSEMPKPKVILFHGERWRPYRTIASWYLWRAAYE